MLLSCGKVFSLRAMAQETQSPLELAALEDSEEAVVITNAASGVAAENRAEEVEDVGASEQKVEEETTDDMKIIVELVNQRWQNNISRYLILTKWGSRRTIWRRLCRTWYVSCSILNCNLSSS